MPTNAKHRVEYGDFQTPLELARQVCNLLAQRGVCPTSILEPTCGIGSFLVAARGLFQKAEKLVGVDINSRHVDATVQSLNPDADDRVIQIIQGDFFQLDWRNLIQALPDPLLVLGNPPWVTNAVLGLLNSTNLPPKSNFQNHRGIDAITGKSNFDIAEWMLLQCMAWFDQRRGTLAMLCKTSTARRVLRHCWQNSYRLAKSAVYIIDAQKHFGVAVESCLLIAEFDEETGPCECQMYSGVVNGTSLPTFGLRDRRLVADLLAYDRCRHLFCPGNPRWRSGVKHDCKSVMELQSIDGRFVNGLNEEVEIEDTCLFPMYKGSEISKRDIESPKRWMLIPQRHISENTAFLRDIAPRTWKYLLDHADRLDRRASSIYKRRPRFSVFGVGEYTFSEWKVALAALYKQPRFAVVGPFHGKPAVLDDTCYFLPCESKYHANAVAQVLNSSITRDALSAYVFSDAKRPITLEVLNSMNLMEIAKSLGWSDTELSSSFKQASTQRQECLF
jgi:hypothetical protein